MFFAVDRPLVGDLLRLKYSKTEMVEKLDDIKHEIPREALRMMGIEKGIEISSIADISAGTGLGSSSCYAVGILHTLHVLKRDYVSLKDLAEEDFKVEAGGLKRPI